MQPISDKYDNASNTGDVRWNIAGSSSITTKSIAPEAAITKEFESKLLLS